MHSDEPEFGPTIVEEETRAGPETSKTPSSAKTRFLRIKALPTTRWLQFPLWLQNHRLSSAVKAPPLVRCAPPLALE